MPPRPGPKLIFGYTMSLHRPVVFGPHGEYAASPEAAWDLFAERTGLQTLAACRDQVMYINQRTLGVIKTILHESKRPAITMIQGDHAFAHRSAQSRILIKRTSCLPGSGTPQPHPEISPVDSLRLVFSRCFGANLSLLADDSHTSPTYDFYRFMTAPRVVLP
jgi:hypothetical protein